MIPALMTAPPPRPLEGEHLGSEEPGPDEAGLVGRVLEGDRSAFDVLVRAHSPRVFRFLHRFVRHRQDAEDLTQQTFLRAYANLGRFDRSRPMINWLLTIARRCALNHFRAAKPWVSFSADEGRIADDHAVAPDRAAERCDTAGSLWERAKAQLSPRQHEALWLRLGEDLSVRDTARVMGITSTHVKVLVFRAKRALRQGVKTL